MKLQLTPSYKTAIDQLSATVSAVPAKPLATKLRSARDLSPDLLEALRTHKIEYDMISAPRRVNRAPGDVLKGLRSLVEENPGDAVLARDVGFSAMELGLGEQAYHLFRRVAEARPGHVGRAVRRVAGDRRARVSAAVAPHRPVSITGGRLREGAHRRAREKGRHRAGGPRRHDHLEYRQHRRRPPRRRAER